MTPGTIIRGDEFMVVYALRYALSRNAHTMRSIEESFWSRLPQMPLDLLGAMREDLMHGLATSDPEMRSTVARFKARVDAAVDTARLVQAQREGSES